LGLGGGLGKKHSIVGEDWGYDGAEVELGKKNGKEESRDDKKGSKNGPRKSQEEGILLSISC